MSARQTGRDIRLSRSEAENLVDLIETHMASDSMMMELAQELRCQWGMSPLPTGSAESTAPCDVRDSALKPPVLDG